MIKQACSYCGNNKVPYQSVTNAGVLRTATIIHKKPISTLVVVVIDFSTNGQLSTTSADIPIGFCPWCGRRLHDAEEVATDEA